MDIVFIRADSLLISMETLPGEAELQKLLKSRSLTLIRAKSPMGHVYRVIYAPPKSLIHTELGTILIKKSEAEDYPNLVNLITRRLNDLIEPLKDDLEKK